MLDGKPYRSYRTITREQAFARGFDGIYINPIPPLSKLKSQTPAERSTEIGEYRSLLYDYRIARLVFNQFPAVLDIDFCRPRHNEPRTRYNPAPNTAVYIKGGGANNVRISDECLPIPQTSNPA